jgi:hypothetical protein
MLAFLLDIAELPESHTGRAMAAAFQKMLIQFGLTQKVSMWFGLPNTPLTVN